MPSAEKLLKFCDQRSLILTDKESKKDSKSIVQSSLPQQLKKTSKPQLSLHISSSSPPCKFCQYGNHRLILCPKFKSMDPVTRHQAAQSVRLCFNCLGSDHSVKTCPSKSDVESVVSVTIHFCISQMSNNQIQLILNQTHLIPVWHRIKRLPQ